MAGVWYEDRLIADERGHVSSDLTGYGNRLVQVIGHYETLLTGLETFVLAHPDQAYLADHFDTYAAGLTAAQPGIEHFAIAPGGVVTAIYPVDGNEEAPGHDLLHDPAVQTYAEVAIRTGATTIQGPSKHPQGDLWLVERKALMVNGSFWGLVTMEADLTPILAEAWLSGQTGVLSLAIKDQNGVVFSGDPALFSSDAVVQQVSVGNGTWAIAEMPAGGWRSLVAERTMVFRDGGLAVILLIALLLFVMASRTGSRRETLLGPIFSIEPLKISFIYLVFGLVWILVSDQVIHIIAYEPEDYATIQSIKGFLFIIITALLLFLLIQHFTRELRGKNDELRASYEEIAASEEELRQNLEDLIAGEQALQESEKRYRLIAENTGDVIWVLDLASGRFTYVSPSVERLRGYLPEEVLLQTLEGVLTPASWCRISMSLSTRLAAFAAGDDTVKVQIEEVDQVRRDGSIVPTEAVTTLMADADRRVTTIIGISRDITERKQAGMELSQRNRALQLISSADSLLVHATDEQTLTDQICAMIIRTGGYRMAWIGYAMHDEAKSIRPVSSSGFEDGYLETINLTWADTDRGRGPTGTAIRTGRYCRARNNPGDIAFGPWREAATHRGYQSSIALPLESNGTIFGALNIYSAETDSFTDEEVILLTQLARDISFGIQTIRDRVLRTAAEQELRQFNLELEERVRERTRELSEANERLKELDRLKSMFIASMSHELRTPLNSIIGFTGIMVKGMAGEINAEQKKQLGMVQESARHLLALINDVIDISKIEAGKIEAGVSTFDLAGLINEVKSNFELEVHDRRLVFSCEIPGPIAITSDKRRIKQVITNLVSNAIKFTDEGRVGLTVEERGSVVVVRVCDTGIGIGKEDFDRLFSPFGRVAVPGRLTEGTGLGLYLSKKLARFLGGDIMVKSEVQRGSVFTFTFPKTYEEQEDYDESTGY
jgi:PAS domain S-box-containing protein